MSPKKKKNGKMKKLKSVWQADPDDAIRLAALRWFALQIESLAIEIYASDKGRYEDLEYTLRRALRRMKKVKKTVNVSDPENCPNGFILCMDGLCAPMCDNINE